jgi:hypothetical protein
MKALNRVAGDDRGAILVHVAIVLLALVAFTTFVADYGVLWVARRQAQNAADAGALAGAIGLGFDNNSDVSDTGPAKESAFLATQRNFVWGQPPSVIKATDITFAVCPDGVGNCVRVDVYRHVTRGNQLPIFFGYFVGLTSQSMQATATAEVAFGNASDCLKPWAVIDKWAEHWPIDPGTWDNSSTYDKYDKNGNPDPAILTPDQYIPPSTTDYGTGFHPFEADGRTYTSDYGRYFSLKVGAPKTDWDYATGWFSALALVDSKGGSDYKDNIEGCIGVTYKVGDEVPVSTEPGEKVGPTGQGTGEPQPGGLPDPKSDINSLYNQDPTAYWDPSLNGGRGGVAGSAYGVSPRIVAVPLVNPDMMIEVQKGGRTTVPISNIMAFFVEGYDNSSKSVNGYLMTMPGKFVAGGGPTGPGGSFLIQIVLVR